VGVSVKKPTKRSSATSLRRSRKLDKPLAIVIQSSIGTAKSFADGCRLLTLHPRRRTQVGYSAMDGQSLFYMAA